MALKTLNKLDDPWKDKEERYIGVILFVNLRKEPNKDKMGMNVYHACWEDIPGVGYVAPWLRWSGMQCAEELIEDKRISYFTMVVTKNMATGKYRVVDADWWGKKVGEKYVDNPQVIWDSLPVHPDECVVSLPLLEVEKTKPKSKIIKRVPKPRKAAAK